MPKATTPAPERFWPKVDKTDTCWLWTAAINQFGYGRFRPGASGTLMVQAHRFAYEDIVGPIPSGLHLDHLCRVRNCVNPAHLEPVTPRENVLRGEGRSAHQARQTHCLRGHELPPYQPGRKRKCAQCLHMHAVQRWAQQKAQVA